VHQKFEAETVSEPVRHSRDIINILGPPWTRDLVVQLFVIDN